MKCFRLNSGGETFFWAGESSEEVLAEFRDAYDDSADPAEITELTDDEMARVTVQLQNEAEEPDGTATLKEVSEA